MSLHLSQASGRLLQSEIRNMTLECAAVGGINLAQGVCDVNTPELVLDAANKAMRDGINAYTRYDGLPALRQAIAAKHRRFTGQDVDPENQIVVSAGATGAFYAVCQALFDPGDELILFEPYYGYHLVTLASLGLKTGFVQLQGLDWTFTREALEAAVTPRTRGLIVNTPCNPCGKVFSREELAVLAEFAQAHDLFVLTDEIYEHFIYDGLEHVSPATLPGMAERTITISGVSKSFSITGWRIGYSICDQRWAQTIGFCNDLVYVCAPAPLQMGVAAGLNELGEEYYAELTATFARKRERFSNALADAGLTPRVPHGAYYALADLSKLEGQGSKARAMDLLKRTGVACVPGKAFYREDTDQAGGLLGRFSFAKQDAVLEEACRRLTRGLK